MHLDHEHSLDGHSHADGTAHTHDTACDRGCDSCAAPCDHTPMGELLALMQYMAAHNAAHTRELAELAVQLARAGEHTAYEQVMAAVSDFEKGDLRLSAVLAALKK